MTNISVLIKSIFCFYLLLRLLASETEIYMAVMVNAYQPALWMRSNEGMYVHNFTVNFTNLKGE